MYLLSRHAQHRIKQRRLKVEWLLAALDGKVATQVDGTLIFCDPETRCALVIKPSSRLVVTAMRLRPSKFKRIYKRRFHHGG